MTSASPDLVLRQVRDALQDARVPYMLTGSFASTLHGAPRTTQDIDIVIAPTSGSLDALLRHFPVDQYYVSHDAASQAMVHESMFNVIDLASGWKIDFIIRKSRPFSLEEFERRREADLWGSRLFVASPEDVILAKLEWAKLGESDRQLADVVGILRAQGDTLDLEYVQRWVEPLQIQDQWKAVQDRIS